MRYFSNARVKQGSWRTLALALALVAPMVANAADEEVPFWAIGMPKDGPGKALAPVPSYPIPTAADQLPVSKIKLPPGFKAEVWASNILDARGMRQGDKGTVFVSSLFVAGKIKAASVKSKPSPKTCSCPMGSSSTKVHCL